MGNVHFPLAKQLGDAQLLFPNDGLDLLLDQNVTKPAPIGVANQLGVEACDSKIEPKSVQGSELSDH